MKGGQPELFEAPPVSGRGPKFAHISDAHLGAFRDGLFRELNFRAFERAVRDALARGVDFIVIAGDLFHNPIPDLRIVQRATRLFAEVRDAGVRVYCVFGSHDFAAGAPSLLDILHEARLFRKVVQFLDPGESEAIRLQPVEDPSGVFLVGLSGLAGALDVGYYEELDRGALEAIPDPKIFVFHTQIAEVKAPGMGGVPAVPLSRFPRGFRYYAGGHVHTFLRLDLDGHPLVYAGAPFGATFADLEQDVDRGYVLVEDWQPRLIPIRVVEFRRLSLQAEGKTPQEVREQLMALAEAAENEGKIVLLTVSGVLRSGSPAEVGFSEVRRAFLEHGAREVWIHRRGLVARPPKTLRVPVADPDRVEEEVLRAVVRTWPIPPEKALRLIQRLKAPKPGDMRQEDHLQALYRELLNLMEEAS